MDRAIGEYLWINDFRNAARILNGFNQADIDKRIKGYTVQQRDGLYDAAETNGGAAIRIRAPIDLGRALDARDWAAAVRVLDTYPEIATRVPGQLRGIGWKEEAHLLGAASQATWRWRRRCGPSSLSGRPTSRPPCPTRWQAPTPALAAEMLNALTDADSAAAIRRLTAAQLFDINAASTTEGLTHVTTELAAEPYAGLIKVEGWDRRLRDSLKRKDWLTAAITLAMYPDDGVRKARLQWLNLDEATAIADLRASGGSALYKLVEARRIEKLGQEYDAALRNKDWATPACCSTPTTTKSSRPGRSRCSRSAASPDRRGAVPGATSLRRRHHASGGLSAYFLVQNKTGAAARPTDGRVGRWGPRPVPASRWTAGRSRSMRPSRGWRRHHVRLRLPGRARRGDRRLQFVGEEIERFDAATAGNSLGYFEPSAPLHGTGQPNEPIEWNTASDRHWYLDAFSDQMPFYESPVSASPPAGLATAGTRGSHSTAEPCGHSGQRADDDGRLARFSGEPARA